MTELYGVILQQHAWEMAIIQSTIQNNQTTERKLHKSDGDGVFYIDSLLMILQGHCSTGSQCEQHIALRRTELSEECPDSNSTAGGGEIL